jgi:hypothetical protein
MRNGTGNGSSSIRSTITSTALELPVVEREEYGRNRGEGDRRKKNSTVLVPAIVLARVLLFCTVVYYEYVARNVKKNIACSVTYGVGTYSYEYSFRELQYNKYDSRSQPFNTEYPQPYRYYRQYK